jgi:hypothetical protein
VLIGVVPIWVVGETNFNGEISNSLLLGGSGRCGALMAWNVSKKEENNRIYSNRKNYGS